MDKKTILTKADMFGLKLQGFSYQAIAKQAGISRQRVQQTISPPTNIRRNVLARYSGRCADCGILVGRSGHIHHENHNIEENYNDIDSLVLLCCSCHLMRHQKGSFMDERTGSERKQVTWGTLERNKRICLAYNTGKPTRELVKLFGLSRQRIHKMAARGHTKP